MIRKPAGPSREEAETIALRAVAFLAEQPDVIRRFLDRTGMTVEELQARLRDGAVLAAVLDFVLWDEKLLLAFAEAIGVPPELPRLARRSLPGATPEE